MNRFMQFIAIFVFLGMGLVAAVVWMLLPAAKADHEVNARPAAPLVGSAYFAANPEVMLASRPLLPAAAPQPVQSNSIQRFGLAETLAAEADAALRANEAAAARYTGLAGALATEAGSTLRANEAAAARYTGLAESLNSSSTTNSTLADNPELLKIDRGYESAPSPTGNILADNPELGIASRYQPAPVVVENRLPFSGR